MKIYFEYGDIHIDLSEYEEIAIHSGVVKYKFEKGNICYKQTNERWIAVIGLPEIEIPEGQQGELYIYSDEDSGTILQATFKGTITVKDTIVYNFLATAA